MRDLQALVRKTEGEERRNDDAKSTWGLSWDSGFAGAPVGAHVLIRILVALGAGDICCLAWPPRCGFWPADQIENADL